MTAESNLVVRGRIFYMRLAYPSQLIRLREAAGLPRKLEVLKSLRTADATQARIRLAEQKARTLAEFQNEIRELEARSTGDLGDPTEADVQQILFAFKESLLAKDLQRRAVAPTANDVGAAFAKITKAEKELRALPGGTLELDDRVLRWRILKDFAADDAERRQILLEELQEHAREGQFVLVEWAMELFSRRQGVRLVPGSDGYRRLGRGLLSAYINALKAIAQRDSSDGATAFDAEQAPPVANLHDVRRTAGSGAVSPAKPRKGERLIDRFEQFLGEQHKGVELRTLKDKRATVKRFVELAGDKNPQDYRREDIVAFKNALRAFPKNSEHLFPGKPMREVVRLNEERCCPVLSPPTVNNKLSTMATFGDWLEQNTDGFDASVFRTSQVPKARHGREKFDEFSDEEVARILMAPLFTGCAGERNQQQPGSYRARDHRYWIVLLCAYHGLRLNEACQIAPKDVQNEGGIWTLTVTDEGPNQSLKTKASRRCIPLHPALVSLGLPAHVERCRERGWQTLIDDVPKTPSGRRSEPVGKWFRKFLARHDLHGNGGMHRFRHTITSKLRAAGLPDHDIAPIAGHSASLARMTSHYGSGTHMSRERMLEALSQVSYEGVDLEKLK